MRRGTAALLVLAASCASMPPAEEQVRAAFEAWRAAAAAGDAAATFRGMTGGFKSEWIFNRLMARDPLVEDWRARMEGGPRTDLDLWLEHQRRYKEGRVASLPASVLGHPSILKLWEDSFSRDKDAVKVQFTGLSIARVYIDETGATVVAHSLVQKSEMYAMVPDVDGWKVDGHREGLRLLKQPR